MRPSGLEPPPRETRDKALNLFQQVQIRPAASRSSIWSGFLDALEALDDMDVATMLPRM
jgi:hypothetical protein